MRRLLALALGLCLWAAPALADITQIIGTGATGQLSPVAYTTAASNPQNITAAVGAGNLVVAIVQSFDTSPTLGCSDAAGNTWQKATNGAFRASAATEIWYSFTTNNLANGATITCTASVHTNGFTTNIVGFSGTTSAVDVTATPTTGSATSTTVGPSPTLACPSTSGGTGCEVCISGVVFNSTGTITSDATWTSIGTASGLSGSWANGIKIVAANTALSYTGSTAVSAAFAGAMACFKAAKGSGNRLGLVGVGQ